MVERTLKESEEMQTQPVTTFLGENIARTGKALQHWSLFLYHAPEVCKLMYKWSNKNGSKNFFVEVHLGPLKINSTLAEYVL